MASTATSWVIFQIPGGRRHHMVSHPSTWLKKVIGSSIKQAKSIGQHIS
jgi:hypothetical protein